MDAQSKAVWRVAGGRVVRLDAPRIMAIINVTPDSFYEGSRLIDLGAAAEAGARAVEAGADVLDIGGESTRPGAERIDVRTQIERVVPVIRAIRAQTGAPGRVAISVDSTRSEVARAALDAGADAINDVSAGQEDPDLLALAGRTGCGLVLMHRLRPPGEDQYSDRYEAPPAYADVVEEVGRFLRDRVEVAVEAGVEPEAVLVDPGLGFGKTVEQNFALIRGTPRLQELAGRTLLSAASRKSFVGRAMGGPEAPPPPEGRLCGSLAVSVMHWMLGVRLFRVHDPGEHLAALRVAEASWGPGEAGERQRTDGSRDG